MVTTTCRIEFHDTYATEHPADIDVVFFIPELGKSVTCRMSRSNILGLARESLMGLGKDIDYRMEQFGEHVSEELAVAAEMVAV